MAKKTSNDENKELLSSKIATDVEAYLATGGTVKQCTHRDNANSTYVKKNRKEHLEDQKRRGTASADNHRQRKQNAATTKPPAN